jgi:O-antigen biosynthesis protein WbqV
LALVDGGEFALCSIDREPMERFAEPPRSVLIGDVRDRRHIDELMASERPEPVFRAAALKHVPMVEADPPEGVLISIIGTRNVAKPCRAPWRAGHGNDLD